MQIVLFVLVAVVVIAGLRDIVRGFTTPMSQSLPEPSLIGLPFFLVCGVLMMLVMVGWGVCVALGVSFAARTAALASPYRQVR